VNQNNKDRKACNTQTPVAAIQESQTSTTTTTTTTTTTSTQPTTTALNNKQQQKPILCSLKPQHLLSLFSHALFPSHTRSTLQSIISAHTQTTKNTSQHADKLANNKTAVT
jgi:hypothetical protein